MAESCKKNEILLSEQDNSEQECQVQKLTIQDYQIEVLKPASSDKLWAQSKIVDAWETPDRRLLIAAGGRPVALLLTFGIVMMPILAASNTLVALVLAIAVGTFLIISGFYVR